MIPLTYTVQKPLRKMLMSLQKHLTICTPTIDGDIGRYYIASQIMEGNVLAWYHDKSCKYWLLIFLRAQIRGWAILLVILMVLLLIVVLFAFIGEPWNSTLSFVWHCFKFYSNILCYWSLQQLDRHHSRHHHHTCSWVTWQCIVYRIAATVITKSRLL